MYYYLNKLFFTFLVYKFRLLISSPRGKPNQLALKYIYIYIYIVITITISHVNFFHLSLNNMDYFKIIPNDWVIN